MRGDNMWACHLFFQVFLGFGIAGSVRVGTALGSGDTELAKTSAKMTMFCTGRLSLTNSFFSLHFSRSIADWTKDTGLKHTAVTQGD